MKKPMNKKTNYMEKLPLEVTLEIFCRLPPESVVQCKLVCKSWLSLLHGDDPNYFANMHLRRHLEYPTTLNFIALYKDGMYEQAKKESLVSIKFHITEYDEEKSSYKMVKTINFSQCTSCWLCVRARLAGSCNGLLCFTRSDRRDHCSIDWDVRIGICNPLLNEYVHLPVSDLQVQYGSRTNDIVVGFGHNPSPLTDEYKVVSVYYSHSAACYNNIGEVEVYTVGTSMWRRIGTIKYKLHVSSQPVLVNGLLHWLSQDRKQKLYDENGHVVVEHQLIVSFDFETEEFQVISLPHDEDDDDFPKMIERVLKVLGGCLCLITHRDVKELMDIWVLKDYMNKESWVKEFSINLKGREPRYWYSFCPIIKKKKNGDGEGDDEILYLWCFSRRLVTYDPKTLYIEEVEGSDEEAWFVATWKYHDPVLHINNSLISLKGLGENARMYREILLPPFNNSCRWRGMHNY